MTVWLHEERSSVFPYGASDQRTAFTPERIAIEKLDGTLVAERRAPYRLLADQGDPYAQCALRIMYDKGQGVPHDYVEAMKWCRRAADQGDALAQNNVGLLHLNRVVGSAHAGSGPSNSVQGRMAGLCHLRPSCTIAADRSLSPDSFRAG
jgi:TPR repeat protein